eukprot:TRINITY_DN170_c0_g1_i1.p1 TRINITY_DN170_c0_g1~~TRINITY_DN170_c0_g1_i1.p1  ORF type:complete len:761 (-),score=98.70 TRINITY_DN170_c0_g1_i1:4646-6703(-)
MAIAPASRSPQEVVGANNLRRAISLRQRWVYRRNEPEWFNYPKPNTSAYADAASRILAPPYDPFCMPSSPATNHVFRWRDGVVSVYADQNAVNSNCPQIRGTALRDFANDLVSLSVIMNDPDTRSFCHRRLVLLHERFVMHLLLNEQQERFNQIAVPHRDFYNVSKVDVHVHHSSMANQKHLLTFIKRKVKQDGDQKVLANREDPNGEPLTLTQVFQSLKLQPHELSVDTLDVHADNTIFHRFDRFNLKYNPFGQSRLREIFMKTDNYNNGKYLAELTHEVFADLKSTKYQNSEYRISIYGRDINEWDKLGAWFLDHEIFSPNVRWLIQIPRLYSIYKQMGRLTSFQDMLDNIFNPIFEATVDPSSHPKVACLLQQIVGFDSVDDESQPQPRVDLRRCGPPEEWDSDENPPYSYYSFFIYSNLAVLNQLRESKGMNTFTYRPHAGEAGDIEHLATSFLLAHGINHGLNLKKSPVLQYLFYITQIGIAMSPLSNNALFCEITKNPLPTFFKRGLNVTLSTDDPLQFAFTREPLMEEYSVAAQVWKLSNTDLCELARNSVLQSGFEPCVKASWLGATWYLSGQAGNDISKTNVPSIRLCYRYETLLEEIRLIYDGEVPEEIHVLPTFSYRRENEPGQRTRHEQGAHSVHFATGPASSFGNGELVGVDDFENYGLSEDEEAIIEEDDV